MLKGSSPADMYERACSVWQPDEISRLMGGKSSESLSAVRESFEAMPGCDSMSQMMATDFDMYMVGDVLTKVDRASMAVSLEAREPFLDHELLEFTARLPLRFKYRDGTSKYLLRQVLSRYLPPEDFLRAKQGFASPVAKWISGPLRSRVEKIRGNAGGLAQMGSLDVNEIQKSIDGHFSAGNPGANQIWLLLNLQFWQDNWYTRSS